MSAVLDMDACDVVYGQVQVNGVGSDSVDILGGGGNRTFLAGVKVA